MEGADLLWRLGSGFGLRFDGVDRFKTTRSIDLGGVRISRSIYVNRGANWGRWLDSFTNTTKRPITIRVAFGGQAGVGIGASGTNNQPGTVVNTSSGDAVGLFCVATGLDD